MLSLGKPKNFSDVISDVQNTDGLVWLNGIFGCHPEKLYLLFDTYNLSYTTSTDRNSFNSMIVDGGTYILAYNNKNSVKLHTVMVQGGLDGKIMAYNTFDNLRGQSSYESVDDLLNRNAGNLYHILYKIESK